MLLWVPVLREKKAMTQYSLEHILRELKEEHADKEFWHDRLVDTAGAFVEQCRMITCLRVSGEVTCRHCGRLYYDHPEMISGFHLLCDGGVGKT